LLDKVVAKMEEMMKRYDPSHDAYHGLVLSAVHRVRKTALAIACTIDPVPDLLVVELAALAH
ncbi:hypothetical protein BS47DRAFT_1348750, partial [Hydnum rufescens UP504]